jgi:hypothetical protein
MSLRFRRSLRIAPGVRLNLGLNGAGLSVGSRGLHVGLNRRGMYSSTGIPGTGLYAVHHYRTGEGHQVRGGFLLGPFLLGVLIAVSLVIIGMAALR